ncbi:hypothetical protein DW958_22065 [Ruminococcus sp. AM46-18]|nr:hypothetical protein DW958_22065 [Ruminococcus sp. AM46-18]
MKYPAKWGVQIAGMIFQTHSSVLIITVQWSANRKATEQLHVFFQRGRYSYESGKHDKNLRPW